MATKTLTQKPFHNIKFPKNYKNTEEKKVKKIQRKPKVYVTPEIFDKVLAVYKQGGSINDVIRETSLNDATARKYWDKARARVASRADEHKERDALFAEVEALKEELVQTKQAAEANSAKWMKEFQAAKTKHEAAVSAYQDQLNKVTLEKTKLEAKVEVMSELLRGKI